MVHGAEALLDRRGDGEERAGTLAERAPAASLLHRSRVGPSRLPDAGTELVRRLAADHLRELRDDGVTLDYVARMYGVSRDRMEILYRELIPAPPG